MTVGTCSIDYIEQVSHNISYQMELPQHIILKSISSLSFFFTTDKV